MDGQEDLDDDVDVFEGPVVGQVADLGQKWVDLPLATMLSLEDADALLRWRPASVIAVVGERNGGKTTLVSEIYERFLRGPFADALFTHSLSLIGFEKKSFQSRAESGAARPDTPRTSAQDGLSFFHLAVSDTSDLRRADLLISERAGEVYREVRDMPERAAELIEIRKATIVAFIVDGERVLDDRRRAEVFASVRNIARALADTGSINIRSKIQLVTTKCDLLDDDSAVGARDALTDFENRLAGMFKGRFEVTAFRTAARDPEGVVEPARGLAPLLRSWLQPPQSPIVGQPELPPLSDEFDKLLLRRIDK